MIIPMVKREKGPALGSGAVDPAADRPDAMPVRQALQQRARAATASGNFAEAAAAWREVLETKHDDPDAAFQLGEALRRLNRLDDAIATLERAAEFDPKALPVKLSLAAALTAKGRHAEARAVLDDVLVLDPGNQPALVALGVALRGLGRQAEALAVLERATKLQPRDAEAAFQWTAALREAKRPEEAAARLREVLAAHAEHREARLLLSRILHEAGRLEEAALEAQRVVDGHPDHLPALNDLAASLLALRDYPRAVAAYRHALSLQPQSAAILCNLSLALFGLDRMEEGVDACRKALAIEPASSTAQFNMACILLAMGRFREGWAAYEFRFPANGHKAIREDITAAPWWGEDLGGKSILVLGEQANGDYIHFSRFVPELERLGAKVFFHLPKRLAGLFSSLEGSTTLLPDIELPARYDFQIHLLSLPHRLERMDRAIPAAPYLRAQPDRVARWRERIGAHGLRIAIAWQGGVYNDQRSNRAFQLADMRPLAEVLGVRLISLQIGNGIEQIDALRGMQVETLGADFDSGDDAFLDTAAVMECVDLVVTCDTSIAHLAGALGRPVWIALNEAPEWRWQRNTAESPWYPSARLFRQKVRGDWDGVFAEMADALRQHGGLADATLPGVQRAGQQTPHVAVSWGECIDKITILEIKAERLTAPEALKNVRRELAELQAALQAISPLSDALAAEMAELRRVNEALWEIEDDIRTCEATQDFGSRFIDLARRVYRTNDERARVKRKVNALTNSALVEEKQYREYPPS